MWREGCYLNNFVQGVLDTFPQEELKGSTIIVSGDGRCVSYARCLIDKLIDPSLFYFKFRVFFRCLLSRRLIHAHRVPQAEARG